MERVYIKKKTYKKTFALLTLCFIFTAYFIYHTIVGKYGLISYFNSIEELETKKEELKILKEDIQRQRTKIKGLKSGTLDLDLLDEQARKKLGHTKENEIIIYDKETATDR